MTNLQELAAIEQQDSQNLLKLVTQESTELVHTVGLLAEEMQLLLQDQEHDHEGVAEINQFILEEVQRVRRLLSAVVLNQALHGGDRFILVLEHDDNVGVLVGGAAEAGESIEVAGRGTRQQPMVTLQQPTPCGTVVTLSDLHPTDTVTKYNLALGKITQPLPQGSLVEPSLLENA